jgi:hypothetical protein
VAEVINGGPAAQAGLADGAIRDTIDLVAMTTPPMANLTFRFPSMDTPLGDFTIAAGDPVMPAVAAAHADLLFSDQEALGSHAHLAWGAGPHHCLARDLATTVVSIGVRRLFDRFARLEPALPADQLPWRSSPLMRALRSLPVRYEFADAPADADGAVRTEAMRGGPARAKTQQPALASLWRFLSGLGRGDT